ncbi:hypothetical protein B0T20DRAFT_61694 [Sordaria brevicollis]|uniref:Uncharacterized protein n=1 Tax=Sordaria brevicollis TaxID=83679 RepID=A0AAE0P3A7_SORBR|nr:hypothetical protein B0T20DRAFT_61694 [Sordaria brevicollis]
MDPNNPLANLTLSMFDAEKNCTAAGAFAAHLRSSYGDENSVPAKSLREFILFCTNTTIGNFTDGNAVDWYRYIDLDNAFANYTSWFEYKYSSPCWRNFCENIEFAGNADLAGIGMHATYVLQAILVTAFLLAYIARDLMNMRHEKKSLGKPSYWNAVDSSLKVFYTLSVYFCFTTILACLIYRQVSEGTPGYAYSCQLAFLAIIFCIEVFQILIPLRFQSSSNDSVLVRLKPLMLISATFVAAVALAFSDLPAVVLRDLETPCLPDQRDFGQTGGSSVIIVMGPVFMIFPGFFIVCMTGLRGHMDWLTRLGIGGATRLCVALPGLVGMWYSIGNFTRLRRSLIEFSGDSSPDGAWGFGQIAAVMGWLPMFVEFFRVWKWELWKGVVLLASKLLRFTRRVLNVVRTSRRLRYLLHLQRDLDIWSLLRFFTFARAMPNHTPPQDTESGGVSDSRDLKRMGRTVQRV